MELLFVVPNLIVVLIIMVKQVGIQLLLNNGKQWITTGTELFVLRESRMDKKIFNLAFNKKGKNVKTGATLLKTFCCH
jgi:hypothetical protein